MDSTGPADLAGAGRGSPGVTDLTDRLHSRVVRASPVYFGWPVTIAAALAMAATLPGQTAGVSLFIDSFIADLGVSRATVSLAYTGATVAASTDVTGSADRGVGRTHRPTRLAHEALGQLRGTGHLPDRALLPAVLHGDVLSSGR